jgi:hypothetical protein
MYGLPKDFDGGFFLGRTLETVSFSENTVFLGIVRYMRQSSPPVS